MTQYRAWLQAYFAKILWKTQIQKSNLGSSSVNKQKAIEEGNQSEDLDQGVNFHNSEDEQALQHDDEFIVARNSQNPHVVVYTVITLPKTSWNIVHLINSQEQNNAQSNVLAHDKRTLLGE